MDPLLIYTDGASRGNPGEAGAGVVIKDREGKVYRTLKKYLGQTTNNQAEYNALILALREVKGMGQNIRILSDSELLVRQVKGQYKVKNRNIKPLFDEARALLGGFASWEIEHIPREMNREADGLANEAIDSRAV